MSHLSIGDIGDVDAAALEPHLATCAQCRRDVDEQRRVRDVLAALPDPGPAPSDVVLAIEAALGKEGGAQAGVLGQTVVPLHAAPSRRDERLVARQARRGPSRFMLAAAAAAAAVVVVGAGGLLANNRHSGGSDTATVGAKDERSTGGAASAQGAPGPFLAAKTVVVASGTAYTRATIVAQVGALLSRPAAGEASRAVGPLATRAGLVGCLRALGADTEPLAVDLATYDGAPAAIVVLSASGGVREVWVVKRTCEPGADGTLYYTKLP